MQRRTVWTPWLQYGRPRRRNTWTTASHRSSTLRRPWQPTVSLPVRRVGVDRRAQAVSEGRDHVLQRNGSSALGGLGQVRRQQCFRRRRPRVGRAAGDMAVPGCSRVRTRGASMRSRACSDPPTAVTRTSGCTMRPTTASPTRIFAASPLKSLRSPYLPALPWAASSTPGAPGA